MIMLKGNTPSPLPSLSSFVDDVVPILVPGVESTRNIDTRRKNFDNIYIFKTNSMNTA